MGGAVMAKKPYFLNDKKYYEVYVQGRDSRGKRVQKRAKFDSNGNRIATLRAADRIEYELKKEIEGLAFGLGKTGMKNV